MKETKNEYQARQNELKKILNSRLTEVKQIHERSYTYANELKQMHIQPIIYSKLKPRKQTNLNKGYVDIFFNEAIDRRYFMYTLVPLIYQAKKKPQKQVPTPKFCEQKRIESQISQKYGVALQTGYLTAKKYQSGQKKNVLNWNTYFYVLRRFTYYFYLNELQPAQSFEVEVTEHALDRNLENLESFAIEEDFYIRKDDKAVEFRRMVEDIVYFRAFNLVFTIDNMVPSPEVADYENGAMNLALDLRRKTKNSARKTKEYKESMYSFLSLLMNKVQKRNTHVLELMIPNTINYVTQMLPTRGVVSILKTNLLPSRSQLLQLHLTNLQHSVLQQFYNRLRDIFPKLQSHVKRILTIKKSQLTDQHLQRILQKLSWPMDSVTFSHNKLTSVGVISLIESAKRLELINLDWSYNEPSAKIVSDAYIKYLETNPSVKSVRLRGSFLDEGVGEWFFEALRNSLWINEIEMDYHTNYSKYISGLKDFEAIMTA